MAIGLCPQTVHPHVGGEHCLCFGWCGGLGGSSPRGWGTPYSSRILKTTSRFIPTWVGNTIRRGRCPGWLPVHPHVGGEHLPYSRTMWSPAGSSPRGWGTRSPGGLCRRWDRFIPTWVGNTLACSRAAFRWAVHPHVGGEHPPDPPLDLDNHGSSPRGWGTRSRLFCRGPWSRFIPTWVGNTSLVSARALNASGSSPRGWGTRRRQPDRRTGHRFIPTWVGNTCFLKSLSMLFPVHPHVGGEHTGFDNVF